MVDYESIFWIVVMGSVIGILCIGMFVSVNNNIVVDKIVSSVNDTKPEVVLADKSHNYTEMVLEDNKLNEKNTKVVCSGTDQKEMRNNGSVICVSYHQQDTSPLSIASDGNQHVYIPSHDVPMFYKGILNHGHGSWVTVYYTLESITLTDLNSYRIEAGLKPLKKIESVSSSLFADELMSEKCIHHIDSRGQGPMLRYQTNGDTMFLVSENVAAEYNPQLSPAEQVKDLDHGMMYNDSAENWGHKLNILNPNATSVSLGFAVKNDTIVLVEDFQQPLRNGYEYDPSSFQTEPIDQKECWN